MHRPATNYAMDDPQERSMPSADEAQSWVDDREAHTLDEAKDLALEALTQLGLPASTWRPSVGSVSPWEYMDVDVGKGEGETLVVGASSGGVVSVFGDPFTPGKREVNVTLVRVLKSLESRLNPRRSMGAVADTDVTSVINMLEKSVARWNNTARRNADALVGDRIIVLDKYERAFAWSTVEGEPVVQWMLPNPDMNGVGFMTPEDAKKVCDRCASIWPENGPYVAQDFRDFAQAKSNESREHLRQLSVTMRANETPVHEGLGANEPAP